METIMEQEKVFHQDNLVTVTQSRFISGGKAYAMRNISSVATHKIEKSRTSPVLFIIIGVVLLFAEIYAVAIILIGIGALWLYGIKDEYSVRIQSNSGEADGLVSTEREYVEKVVEAINKAMIFRG